MLSGGYDGNPMRISHDWKVKHDDLPIGDGDEPIPGAGMAMLVVEPYLTITIVGYYPL